MARQPRHIRPNLFYHVLNRSAGRIAMFRRPEGYAAFERILLEAHDKFPLRLIDWCIMPNHWHFVVWPEHPHDLTNFFRWLTHTHAMRFRVARRTVGWGHLYQGRFKAFPVEEGGPLRSVRRYVQRNALTANLVKRAEAWRWSSLWLRQNAPAAPPELRALLCKDAPRLMPNWLDWINEPITRNELHKLRLSVARNRPFGTPTWTTQIAAELHLQHTLRPEGRPPKLLATNPDEEL